MFNKKIARDYIDIVKEDPDLYYKDFKEMEERVKNSSAIYKGEPIPVTYQGMLIGQDHKKDFDHISKTLMTITRKIVGEYLENPDYRKLFHHSSDLEELILTDPGYEVPVPMCRYDMFYNGIGDYKFCEFNTDGSSAMNEDQVIGSIMLDSLAHKKMGETYDLSLFELFDSWVEASYEIYKTADQARENPNVAILDFTGLGTSKEFERFKKAYEDRGFACRIVDPRDVVYKDGAAYDGDFRLDLVYRRAVTVEIMRHKDEIKDYLNAYKDKAFVQIGSFRSQIMHSKLIFQIFRDPMTQRILTEEENAYLEDHIPFTEILDTKEDYDRVTSNRDGYIIKPFDSYASDGVYAGREYTDEEWKKIIDDAYQNDYIYQEYVDMSKVEIVEFDQEGKLSVGSFSLVMGMFIYNEKFQGLYTRIGNEALISGARDYYTAPNILAIKK